ncbi:MAG: hypothetical protein P1U74_05920 [Legionellaceae bacterium]|nr:hypothetical protein [Legionellaceae bacterium]
MGKNKFGNKRSIDGWGSIARGGTDFMRNMVGSGLKSLDGSISGRLAKVIETNLDIESYNPDHVDDKLTKYEKSYDLEKYQKYALSASKQMEKATQHIARTGEAGQPTAVDLSKFGDLGKGISESLENTPEMKDDVEAVQGYIGSVVIPPSTLSGKDGVQGKLIALSDEIKSNSDKFHRPQQIINAFKQLRDESKTALQAERKDAEANIREHFIPKKEDVILTEQQELFAKICGIDTNKYGDNKAKIDKQITTKAEQMIKHVDSSYAKAEADLDKYFKGTPASKKDDKEIPAVIGMNDKLEREKERVEADLLLKINYLERLENRGYDIGTGPQVSATVGGTPVDDKEDRAAFLKGKKLQDLQNVEVSGMLFGTKKLNHQKTEYGTVINLQETNGEVTGAGFDIPAQMFQSDEDWEKAQELNWEALVDNFKALDRDTSSITLTIDHKIESNRNMSISAAYKAARLKGYSPDQIKFSVSGSDDEKKNFDKKPASDVLKAVGLGGIEQEVAAKIATHNQSREKISEKHKGEDNVKDRLANLKMDENKSVDDDEYKVNDDSTQRNSM